MSDTVETPSGVSPPPPGGDPASAPQGAPSISIPENFAYAKDGQIDFDTWSKDAQELVSLRESVAKAREGVPEAPDGYKLQPSADWKYKDGRPQELKADDPLWGQFREWAHAHNVPQAGIDALVGMYAAANRAQVDEWFDAVQAQEAEAEKASALELAKLAPATMTDDKQIVEHVKSRLEGVDNWLTSVFGEEGAALAKAVRTAGGVKVLEALREATKDVEIGGAKPNGAGDRTTQPMASRWYGAGAN